MQQRRNQEQLSRSIERQQVGTTVAALGDGYPTQLARMQEVDRKNKMVAMNYASSVGTDERQRQEAERQRLNQVEAMSKNYLNERAQQAAHHHMRMMNDHKEKLTA